MLIFSAQLLSIHLWPLRVSSNFKTILGKFVKRLLKSPKFHPKQHTCRRSSVTPLLQRCIESYYYLSGSPLCHSQGQRVLLVRTEPTRGWFLFFYNKATAWERLDESSPWSTPNKHLQRSSGNKYEQLMLPTVTCTRIDASSNFFHCPNRKWYKSWWSAIFNYGSNLPLDGIIPVL
jgi:hypothetical protein